MGSDPNSEIEDLSLVKKDKVEKTSFIKDLLQRRVPQILGIYLATSWAIIEFLDWLISRFSISPNLPELGLIILASMIPTILLLAYFHGKPGRDTWTKTEKIGIPINVLGAILLVFFLFKGKDLGATTTMITLTNEEGQTIERVIPKSEFRKKIMLFFLENESGDTTLNWLCYGITDMLSTDLVQDFYIEVRTGHYYSSETHEKVKEAGFSNLIGLPLMLEKELAEEMHMNNILTGSFTKTDDIYTVNTKLYNTQNGKLLNQNTFVNQNIFDLVDQLSLQLKYDLEIPNYHIEEVVDLPVSEISTKSIEAYKWYIEGSIEYFFNQDWDKAINYLNHSVQVDSTFSIAYFYLSNLYMITNQLEKGAWIFKPLMNHLYKLPEKMQLHVKAIYYDFKRQHEKTYAIYEMLVSLYPDDIESRLSLIAVYKIRNQIEEAIAEYKYILKLDPERHLIFKEIGLLYKQLGMFEESLKYFNNYAEHFPDRPESFEYIGSLHKTMGNLDKAKSFYNKALLLEYEDISIMVNLAEIESELGNFDQALKQYQDALEISNTPKEKALIYTHLQYFHELRGKMKKALDYLYLKHDEWEKYMNPLFLTASKIMTFDQFVKLESEDVVFRVLEALKKEIDKIIKNYASVGYLYLYLELEDIEKAENSIDEIEEVISKLKVEALRKVILNARAKIHELQGEYNLAVQRYMEQFELEPTNSEINVNIGVCYRNLKNYKRAEEYIQKALKIHPYWPDANYEIALVYYETDKQEKALEYMKIAMSIWEEADSDFEPAIKAREKLFEWGH